MAEHWEVGRAKAPFPPGEPGIKECYCVVDTLAPD